MKYAAYFDSAIPAAKERARADVIAETLYLVNYAEDLGFDAAFFPEHHFTAEGYDPTPLVMSALAAARTSRIIVGTGILLLPMHHPLHVAEQAAVIDMASGGRFHLGVGLGYRPGEFEAFGIDRRTRGARMDESLAIIRQYLEGKPFSFDGEHYRLGMVEPVLQPTTGREMPIWVGARGPAAAARAGKYGCSFIAGTSQVAYDSYIDALQANGHDAALRSMGATRTVYVGESDEAAWDEAGYEVFYETKVAREWYAGAADLEGDKSPQYESIDQRRRVAKLIGSPETVLADLEQLRNRYTGPVKFNWIFMNPRPANLDLELTKRSMRRFMEEVVPEHRKITGV
jgi:alkanesulfonate monooxygenase SsuD/methylene tetrahydromethanopterin reductase-like flavin-dependent oxidoreductase (luciferase family)